MSTNIQETHDKLRELDRVTAPAPWGITYSGCLETIDGGGMVIKDAEGGTVAEADVDFGHHWFFIDDTLPLMTELRNAVPALLTEIDRLSNELRVAEAMLGRVATSHPEVYLASLGGDEK